VLRVDLSLQIRELEELMADTARWDALSPQERKEKQQHFNSTSKCLTFHAHSHRCWCRSLLRYSHTCRHLALQRADVVPSVCCAAAHNLQADIYLAGVYVRLLRRTTEDITHTWLLPEMVERVASMLTYFMDALVGMRLE
jgi:Ubiquitin elongating factor core